MRIGIITFHWADNYGAVLQAYALQNYLQSLGHKVEIVNYYPVWARRQFDAKYKLSGLKGCILKLDKIIRLNSFKKFRTKYLNVSNKSDCCYDMVITGSDQVFNPDIIAVDEKLDTKYLLENIDAKYKISYAASFGNSTLEDKYNTELKKYLSGFDFLGVRERSGVEILHALDFNNVYLNPDPTFLLNNFGMLINIDRKREKNYLFKYVFNSTNQIDTLVKNVLNTMSINNISQPIDILQMLHGRKGLLHASVKKWLRTIRDAQIVITDSFHCTVFCILFQTPFFSICSKGWGKDWSERLKCLLDGLGLSSRLMQSNADDSYIQEICKENIDWDDVAKRCSEMRKSGQDYLITILNDLSCICS